MNGPKAVTATFGRFLSTSVTGNGTITGGPINCGGICSAVLNNGVIVSLSATTTDPAWSFTGWSGDCSGVAGCSVTMNGPRGVMAVFEKTTLVTLSSFSAAASVPVRLEWTTVSELNTAGFNLYRSEYPEGPYVRINGPLIPASANAVIGSSYAYADTQVVPGRTYYYQLEDVELTGTGTRHPIARVEVPAAATLDNLPLLGLGLGAAVLALAAVGLFFRRYLH
ncbi:MAG: hypothetical protein WCF84_14680 [Anaerolineae bacterium]